MPGIIGYADALSVRPGDNLAFKVSCENGASSFRADIVRLICGDDRPDGPGFKEEVQESAAVNGSYPGRKQAIDCGSYVLVPPSDVLTGIGSFTLGALIRPGLPGEKDEVLAGHWLGSWERGSGYMLALDRAGRLCLRIGRGGKVWSLTSRQAFHPGKWHRVVASLDVKTHAAMLSYAQPEPVWGHAGGEDIEETVPFLPDIPGEAPFMMAACLEGLDPRRQSACHFNGRIEAPYLTAFYTPLRNEARFAPGPVLAAWDFSREISSDRIIDTGPHGLHGYCINLPARGVTGHNWSGNAHAWKERPQEYAAIHFHDDDLYDCGWEDDFVFQIPEDLKSGIYAARLRCEDGAEDYVPFFVLPPRGKARSPVAFLASTATYMAYANSHDAYEDPFAERTHGMLPCLSQTDLFLMQRRDLGLSTYDTHKDGSGCFYSSRLRPILNMRPKTALWSLNADLHITDWLEAMGQSFDVIDDETLEKEGTRLLEPYACVITGAHPEYYSKRMLDALSAWTEKGGRLAYLGGNGFYWRIGWHRTLPGVIEVRRGDTGTRSWPGQPGESCLSTTGEPGSIWKISGRAPQKLAGIGYISEGFDSGSYYRRQPGSLNPRAAFIFEGVEEEIIGDFGAFGGAAALELDAMNPDLGTPAHALCLASSEGHSNVYAVTMGEMSTNYPGANGVESPLVKADMVFFETPGGGAVFSTGSIGWAGSLAHEGYDNVVSRITWNVIRRFADPEPFS